MTTKREFFKNVTEGLAAYAAGQRPPIPESTGANQAICACPYPDLPHTPSVHTLAHRTPEPPTANAALVERLAEAIHAYNTSEGHYFVIHLGGYEGIARAVLPIIADLIAEKEAERDALRVTLAEVLGHFWQKGHPGTPCLRTDWVRVEKVTEWHGVLSPGTAPPANKGASP